MRYPPVTCMEKHKASPAHAFIGDRYATHTGRNPQHPPPLLRISFPVLTDCWKELALVGVAESHHLTFPFVCVERSGAYLPTCPRKRENIPENSGRRLTSPRGISSQREAQEETGVYGRRIRVVPLAKCSRKNPRRA